MQRPILTQEEKQFILDVYDSEISSLLKSMRNDLITENRKKVYLEQIISTIEKINRLGLS